MTSSPQTVHDQVGWVYSRISTPGETQKGIVTGAHAATLKLMIISSADSSPWSFACLQALTCHDVGFGCQ